MKPYVVAAAVLLACAPALAQPADGPKNSVDWDTMMLRLSAIETAIDRMSRQMESMANDIKDMKQCGILARQVPLSLDELRDTQKPATREADARLVEMYRHDVAARLKCGLQVK